MTIRKEITFLSHFIQLIHVFSSYFSNKSFDLDKISPFTIILFPLYFSLRFPIVSLSLVFFSQISYCFTYFVHFHCHMTAPPKGTRILHLFLGPPSLQIPSQVWRASLLALYIPIPYQFSYSICFVSPSASNNSHFTFPQLKSPIIISFYFFQFTFYNYSE